MEPFSMCLALTIYWEARGEPILGQLAVGQVIMTRVKSWRWPNTICLVVKQKKRGICQFSYYCDGLSDWPTETEAWKKAKALAHIIQNIPLPPYAKGADHYHNDTVNPYWADSMNKCIMIGKHTFFKDRTLCQT